MHKDTWFSHSSEKMCIKYIRFLFFLVRESFYCYVKSRMMIHGQEGKGRPEKKKKKKKKNLD